MKRPISARRRFILTNLIMITASGLALAIMTGMLYSHNIEDHREQLQTTVQSQARLIEAMARFAEEHSEYMARENLEYDATAATLSQIVDAHGQYKGFGETGEFTLARRDGDLIVFVLRHRYGTVEQPVPVAFESDLAEPMRRALNGLSGTVIALDYRAEMVLAAHEPVDVLNLGIVAKIDLVEIRAPFIKSGLLALAAAMLVILAGTALFFRVGKPLMARLEAYAEDLEMEIEERERAEKALRISEESLKKAQEISKFGSWEWDSRTDQGKWSEQVYRMFGFEHGDVEISFEWLLKQMHPDDRERVSKEIERAVNEQGSIDMEYRVFRKDGSECTVHSLGQIRLDEAGKTIGVIGTIQDITERKRAAEQLQYQANIHQQISDAVITTDRDLKIISWNEAATTVYGWTEAEAKGQTIDAILKTRWSDESQEQAQQALAEAGIWHGEIVQQQKSGRTIEVSATVSWIKDLDDNIVGGVTVNRDITQRKRAEDALRQSEEHFRQFFENAPEYCYMISPEGTILDVNTAALEVLDYEKEELLGRPLQTVYAPESLPNMKQNIEKWQKTGEIKDVEMIILTKEGQRHDVLLSVGAVRDRDGEILYSISVQRDITERKRVEEALKQSHDQLRRLSAHLQSVREEEKGEMAREIHDELGQRLTALQLDLAWLNKRLPDKSEPLEKKMVSMNDLLSSTSQLVDKISASLRPGILDDLGLVPAIEWQVEQFQDTAGIPCELVITPEDFTLDRERSTAIFRILQESLTNVARHAEATNVRITVARTVDRIALEVVDNGKGITEEQISQSTSLGLVGMQERMYTWDGEFKISGRPGKGTTVSVKIPITEERESND